MNPAPQHGFSLIELMVTIVIFAVLVLLGVPSYQEWILNSRIRNASESIQNGLRLARNEATQRDLDVRFELTSAAATADWTVCALTATATSCTDTGAVPIQSFVASGGAGGVLVGASVAIAQSTTFDTGLTGGLPAGITFDPLGRPTAYGTTSLLRIDAYAAQAGSRRLVTTISPGGQVRMCDPQLPLSTSPQGCK
ncbi:MAG: GspH/FimT family pseudopilin [Rhodanobacter sp.]|uniref:GspH/FimT family pseudopilin n=1 Tax=Rhodanobacter sp. PCA2 TaxID=2006117 RepID=UPI0015E6ED61|nr:GspH/FimT family pseudopilin [Rhodanobacter sp. PCA2]MBA2077949.1 pilin [Rhodanobacter sp. PCA2]MBN8922037.1 GspH/FimT family pseudopilin [Rhodanobacter sp.]